ncbi:hypothetical protein [Streptomyces liangshanensis]|uniref:hypothetical protein n=1 Tax=Streptomyces liangshanensis TaxID=2717324 RepID=UPI0036DF0562
MTVFYCAKCGAELSAGLVALPTVPGRLPKERDRDRRTRLAPSTVPRGRYAVDPEPWGPPYRPARPGEEAGTGEWTPPLPPGMTGMVFDGPRNTVIVHPDDVPGLREVRAAGAHWGCCGPLGTGGRNMACGCGTLVGTLVADCMGPYELHLDPVRVYLYESERPAPGAEDADDAEDAAG